MMSPSAAECAAVVEVVPVGVRTLAFVGWDARAPVLVAPRDVFVTGAPASTLSLDAVFPVGAFAVAALAVFAAVVRAAVALGAVALVAGVLAAGVLAAGVLAASAAGRARSRATVSAVAAAPRVFFAGVDLALAFADRLAAAFAGAVVVAAVFVGEVFAAAVGAPASALDLAGVDLLTVDLLAVDLAAVDLLAADVAEADFVGADLFTVVFAAGLAATRFAPVFAALAGFAVVDVAFPVRPDGAAVDPVAAAARTRLAVLVAASERPV